MTCVNAGVAVMAVLLCLLSGVAAVFAGEETKVVKDEARVVTWPGPAGVEKAKLWAVKAGGKDVFVYPARVREAHTKPAGAKILSHEFMGKADEAGVAIFDFEGTVEVEVKVGKAFKSATVLPTSAGIVAEVTEGVIRFSMKEPRAVAVLLDGKDDDVLHVLTDRPEREVVKEGDPEVVYFGPGVHEVEQVVVKPGETVYLAGGAVLKAVLPKEEKPVKNERTGLATYKSGAVLKLWEAPGAKVMGRGVIDCQNLPHAARQTIGVIKSPGAVVEGVTLLNAANWNLIIAGSDGATVKGVKVVSGRFNSDGINTVTSSHVRVTDCFVRNHDDSFAVKAMAPDMPVKDVVYERCTAWNDWGYALGVTYETRAAIHDVTWRDCDVMTARHWAIGVYVVDSGTVSDVLFENIRVEGLERAQKRWGAMPMLANFKVGSDMWATDKERGKIKGVMVKGLKVYGGLGPSEVVGMDDGHKAADVVFEDVEVNGKPVADAQGMKLKVGKFGEALVK